YPPRRTFAMNRNKHERRGEPPRGVVAAADRVSEWNPGRIQALRGHVTRTLLGELRPVVAAAGLVSSPPSLSAGPGGQSSVRIGWRPAGRAGGRGLSWPRARSGPEDMG